MLFALPGLHEALHKALRTEALLENKPATISRDETCGRNLLAGI